MKYLCQSGFLTILILARYARNGFGIAHGVTRSTRRRLSIILISAVKVDRDLRARWQMLVAQPPNFSTAEFRIIRIGKVCFYWRVEWVWRTYSVPLAPIIVSSGQRILELQQGHGEPFHRFRKKNPLRSPPEGVPLRIAPPVRSPSDVCATSGFR